MLPFLVCLAVIVALLVLIVIAERLAKLIDLVDASVSLVEASARRLMATIEQRENAAELAQGMLSSADSELHELRLKVERYESTGTGELLGKRVVTNLNDGTSIRGQLVADYEDTIVLDHAEYLNGTQPEAFAGSAFIPRATLLWTQALGDG